MLFGYCVSVIVFPGRYGKTDLHPLICTYDSTRRQLFICMDMHTFNFHTQHRRAVMRAKR
jgi:hypothetical protein